MDAFLVGLAIGATASILGAVLSYWFGLRRTDAVTRVPLVYLVLIVLGLGALGAVVTVRALSTGQVMSAFVAGLGVVVGFTTVFAVLLALYIRRDRG